MIYVIICCSPPPPLPLTGVDCNYVWKDFWYISLQNISKELIFQLTFSLLLAFFKKSIKKSAECDGLDLQSYSHSCSQLFSASAPAPLVKWTAGGKKCLHQKQFQQFQVHRTPDLYADHVHLCAVSIWSVFFLLQIENDGVSGPPTLLTPLSAAFPSFHSASATTWIEWKWQHRLQMKGKRSVKWHVKFP